MTLASALAIIVLASISFYGWGRIARRLMRMPNGGWPTTIALGLAGVVFLGGVANLARIAFPATIGAIFAFGLLAAGIFGRAAMRRISFGHGGLLATDVRKSPTKVLIWGCIGVLLVFQVYTQASPSGYNYHDDYQKYFALPVRMIETGTLFGSPLSAVGLETLGGHAFLQGFIVAFLPIRFINSADTVFGLCLCAVVAIQSLINAPRMTAIAIMAILTVLVVDPNYVNISSLYLSAGFVLSSIVLGMDEKESNGRAVPNAAAVALLYAAVIASKSSNVMFAGIHLTLLVIAAMLSEKSLFRGVRWGLLCFVWLIVFLLPWVLLHLPHYKVAIIDPIPPISVPQPPRDESAPGLFSSEPLMFGGSMIAYTLLSALTCATAVFCVAVRKRVDQAVSSRIWWVAAAGIASLVVYVIAVIVLGGNVAGAANTMRYVIPFATATAATVLPFAASLISRTYFADHKPWHHIALAAGMLLPLLAFFPSFFDRMDFLFEYGHQVSFRPFSITPAYLNYCEKIVHPDTHDTVRQFQNIVPPGEPVIVWIDMPFWLDYSRNPIYDVDVAGLVARWARMPKAKYAIVQYKGFAMRKKAWYDNMLNDSGEYNRIVGARSFEFAAVLSKRISKKGKRLYDNGSVAVYFMPDGMEAP